MQADERTMIVSPSGTLQQPLEASRHVPGGEGTAQLGAAQQGPSPPAVSPACRGVGCSAAQC